MKRRGFTLMELLVVIAILAWLMACLLPAFSRSRQQAKTVVCRSNLRQLLQGLYSYDQEFQSLPFGFDFKNGVRPPGGYIGNVLNERLQGWWWFHYTGVVRNRSYRALDILRCPSSRLGDADLDFDVLCGKYGVNRLLCRTNPSPWPTLYKGEFIGRPVSLANLRHSSQTLLMVDSGYSLICWWNAMADPPVAFSGKSREDTAYIPGLALNKNKIVCPGENLDAVGGRHPNWTVNIGFADGHVGLQPAADLLVEKTQEGSPTNTILWQGH